MHSKFKPHVNQQQITKNLFPWAFTARVKP